MACQLSLLYFILVAVAAAMLPKCTSSTNFTFIPNTPGINCSGDAGLSGNVIQLTQYQMFHDINMSSGHAVYSKLVQLRDPQTGVIADFTSNFTFNIRLKDKNNPGDGLAFFIAPELYTLPDDSTGGWLGLYNSTTNSSTSTQLLAVEFDTFQNPWDPDDNHIGINLNSIVSIVNASLSADMNLKGKEGSALITFNSTTSDLSVTLTYEGQNALHTPALTRFLNLSDLLPEKVVVGFSASTGAGTELHEILSWQFSSKFAHELDNISVAPEPSNPVPGAVAPEPSDPVPGAVAPRSKKNKSLILGLILTFAGILVGAGCGYVYISKRLWWKQGVPEVEDDDPVLDPSIEDQLVQGTGFPRKFTYKELVLATNNFSEDGKLGQGGFGGVYSGSLPDGEKVAVKKISRESNQGKKEYVSEVTVISKLRHRNLVRLIGWCHEHGEFLLVYEYMPNGSLDYYLFGKRASLDWERRYHIVNGLASGLLYLHEEWEQCVVHRDVKSSNVMLDSGFNARLGDFGLARMVDHDLDSQTTVLAGTMGYMAPECFSTGKASKESDVFSFGVVALEVACGRRAIEARKEATEVSLVGWVWGLYGKGRLKEAADIRLIGVFDEMQLERMAVVGLWCAHPDAKSRPTIRQAMNVLALQAPLPGLPRDEPKLVYLALPSDIHDFSETTTTTTTTTTTGMSSRGETTTLLSSSSSDYPRLSETS